MTDDDLDRLAAAIAPALHRHARHKPETGHSDARRDVNVEKSGVWMDYKTLTGVLCALAVAVWIGSGWFSQLQFEMREVRTIVTGLPRQVEVMINSVRDSLSERITRLEAERPSNNPDNYGRVAHDLWCLETEKLNRDIGWDCAPLPGSRQRPAHLIQPQDYYPSWSTEITKDRAKP